MIIFTIAFLLGDLWLQTFSQLPSVVIICSCAIAGMILIIKKTKKNSASFGLIFGFVYTYIYASSLISIELSSNLEDKNMMVTGYIASLPVKDNLQTHFNFIVDHVLDHPDALPKKSLIRLSWRDVSQRLMVGDKWQFTVRLKRIHGIQNPGGFDFEKYALQKGLRAIGHVVPDHNIHLIAKHPWRYPIDRTRERIQLNLQKVLPSTPTAAWLQALIIGERQGISGKYWQVLKNTGTNHLMVIAGLHIGIIAGLLHLLISHLWRILPGMVLRLPSSLASAIGASIGAVIYSALAGFSIPTQRACVMLSIYLLVTLRRYQLSPWSAWSATLMIVLLLNPLAILSESFWLSFCTIALIIYGMSGRLAPHSFWWKWGRVQWVIGVGLIPLTLFFYQQASLISFIANSIAIPWLGFLILPFCLIGTLTLMLYPPLASFILKIADLTLSQLWSLLTWLSSLSFAVWQHDVTFILLIPITIGFLLLLIPSGMPGRWVGLVFAASMVLFEPAKPSFGDVWLTLLDVGQGLSIVVQTASHTLVYDAGPRFTDQFDMGESVVLPFLRTRNISRIDKLVVSHGDNDHIGGTGALLREKMVDEINTSVPDRFQFSHTFYCNAETTWQWEGVTFRYLYPSQEDLSKNNDSSCVLRIQSNQYSVLLTGDIEKWAEERLVQRASSELASDIMFAPHHGSKTSGVSSFLKAVHPKWVLYGIGYRNRYHFPHQQIVNAYYQLGALQLNTASEGAINLKLEKAKIKMERYRRVNRHYWYLNMP